jgi:hypothetical protein
MSRLRVIALALVAVLLVGVVSADARSKHKPPSKSKVTKLLVAQYTQESKEYASVRESYKVQKLVRGKARLGTHRADGVPPNTKTYVFPIKVKGVYVKCYSSDGSAVRQTIKGDYVFFKDEFGSWTFRIRDENRSPEPGSDRIPSCPL